MTLLLTGFEPFGTHVVNPSWEVASRLNGAIIGDLKVVAQQLPVVYDEVPSILASLWKKYDVKLCVHCGVGLTGPVRIEKRAHNFSYERLDNKKSAPFDGACVQGAARVLETSVNIKMLIESLPETPIDIVESTDAGRYLCEFTYFFSLHLFRAPVLFVHVPPFSEEVTLDSLSKCISAVLLGAQSTLSLRLPGLLRPQVGLGVVVTSKSHPGCVLVGRRITPNAPGHGTIALPVSTSGADVLVRVAIGDRR